MHEYILADRVLQSVVQLMDEKHLSSINEVEVNVGELLGLERRSLNMAYQLLSKGTKADGSKLKVHRTKGVISCKKCGYEGGLKDIPTEHTIDPAFACPKCGAPVSINSGNEVKVISVS
jgi:hydrogenase nickel incorporation protein HypA/HybF